MFVGPFFYLEHTISGTQGLLADFVDLKHAEKQPLGMLDNPVSHQTLFDRLQTDIEYMDIPRGRVIYDPIKHEAVVYMDTCIEEHLSEIVRAFEITNFRVEQDEHYVCPGCWDLDAMWE